MYHNKLVFYVHMYVQIFASRSCYVHRGGHVDLCEHPRRSELEVLHPRRGAQYVNVKGYSAAPDFLDVFALAHSKINQIAEVLDDNVRNYLIFKI